MLLGKEEITIFCAQGFSRGLKIFWLTAVLLLVFTVPLHAVSPGNQVTIKLDDELFLPLYPYFSSPEGRLMIAAPDAARLLGCRLEWVDNSQLQLVRQDTTVSMREGIPEAIYNDQIMAGIPMPLKRYDTLYLSLRSTAELFGFTVIYDGMEHSAKLYSPGAPVPSPPPAPLPDKAPANLPVWGSCTATPGLEYCWPGENLFSSYYTTLLDRSAGRTQNVVLSCQAINGWIIQPGEVFSFNEASGPRTDELGYQIAPIFVCKKVVPGRGGGVCQTSSTLYNCVLEAGLEVVERYPHSLPVAYAAPGRDATVSWGGADLKFRNNKEVPVKILARVWDKYVLCAIAAVD